MTRFNRYLPAGTLVKVKGEMKFLLCWHKRRRENFAESRISRRREFLPPMVATVGWRLISTSTCIEEMRNSSSRQVRLDHDNGLAKGGLHFRFACKLPPAPYILSSFVCLFVRRDFCALLQATFLRYRHQIVQAHCPRGGMAV